MADSVHWDEAAAAAFLRRPVAGDNKYRRGVLGARVGSGAYPGAAVLAVSAAWGAGAGLVRYVPPLDDPAPLFGLPTPAAAVLAARPETVFGEPTGAPCDAWMIGSGTDPAHRSASERLRLSELLAGTAPIVIDAGSLDLALGDGAIRRAPVILTPHSGEFARLWALAGLTDPVPAQPNLAAAGLATALHATVLLKGPTTTIATPGGRRFSCSLATPWLASAGTGDVLTGVLGALVAAHAARVREEPELLGELGATAAVIHGIAGRIASDDPDGVGAGRPTTALAVAHAVPLAWAACS